MTYENGQARERTQILMDLSNKLGGLVIGTGDLSELALGWATYNGDHMSMYGVNASIPKTLIRYLVGHVANNSVDEQSRLTLLDIIDTPISPELIPADEDGNISQKTEDLVGPYELHDFFLYYFLRFGFRPAKLFMLARHAFDVATYDDDVIKHWLRTFIRRFFQQQFKRSCLPDGPRLVVFHSRHAAIGACLPMPLQRCGWQNVIRFKVAKYPLNINKWKRQPKQRRLPCI